MAAVGRASRSHRAPETGDKPLVRGSVAVGATAALGAIVTGSLLAVGPGSTQSVADVAPDNLTPLDLTNASQALAMQPETLPEPMHGASDAGSPTTLLPVTAQDDHFAAADRRDVEMLHRPTGWRVRQPPRTHWPPSKRSS